MEWAGLTDRKYWNPFLPRIFPVVSYIYIYFFWQVKEAWQLSSTIHRGKNRNMKALDSTRRYFSFGAFQYKKVFVWDVITSFLKSFWLRICFFQWLIQLSFLSFIWHLTRKLIIGIMDCVQMFKKPTKITPREMCLKKETT